jgi:hypothetical protein
MDEETINEGMPISTAYTESERSLKYQLDIDEILDEIEHILKNEQRTFNPETGMVSWEKPKYAKPLINEKGINRILSVARAYDPRSFALSDLEDDDIRKITRKAKDDIIIILEENYELFEIDGHGSASMIVDILVDRIYTTLRRALMGRTLNYLRTTQRIHDVQSTNYQERPQVKENSSGGGGLRTILNPFKK